jgi:hypothetical protein
MPSKSDPSMFARSLEPLNHIPPLPLHTTFTLHIWNPAPRNLAATLWDRGRGPTINQARNESSHNDSPIMSTQQICRHRPLLPFILHKITLCWPQLRCKQIPTETHSANKSSPSLLPATHLRLGPLRALIIPRRHLPC